ncbi:MAG TPA: RluA family pseudouridine synthase [Acholeplasma sp.]|nr:RluA family pseudouridine synthase [Acholeplasma sp.]
MKQEKIFKIESEFVGERLDQYLVKAFEDKSRSFITNLIKNGDVLVNGNQVKPGYSLKLNDQIYVAINEPKSLDLEPVNLDLDIVYEDSYLLVVNKPEGLVVHPAESYDGPTLVHGLLYQSDELSSINGVKRPGIVHRIDKDTSGLLIVAKNDIAHQRLSEAFSKHEVKRIYTALVYGKIDVLKGVIDMPIGRHRTNRLKMAVDPEGKRAVTHFKVLEQFDKYTLIECELETGRTHQIRVHMAHIGYPIVGDPIYGPKDVIGDTGQFLHAHTLTFVHPIKNEHMTFTVDMPESFKQMLNKLR